MRRPRSNFYLTLDEITDLRVEELRRFFQGRFGRHWLKALRSRLGRSCSAHFFHQPKKRSLQTIRPYEALAVSLGFRPTRFDLLPHERKKLARLDAFKQSANLQLCLPNAVDDASLCAMTLHKLRPRPLKDDVFPAYFLENWCEE